MIKKYYLVLLVSISLLTGLFTSVSAHSVQVAYCVSCNGNLRIFFEHWHGYESINSTSMTISLTVNNVVSTQTASPQSAVYATTLANLPGCSTPIIVAAACPGQANNYNNWVIFDYVGLPCGVPISFTVISGNTVFTTDACGMYPLTVPFLIPCNSNFLSNINVCDGVTTSPIVVPPNTVWTNSNPAIGLPAFGVGNIPSFTPIGPTASAVISYVSACVNSTFNIYVTPNPTASFTATTVCEGYATTYLNQSAQNCIYTWDFGDATTSNVQNPPPHTYALPGIYTVTLVVADSGGCAATATQQVIVEPLPIPSFTAANVCAGSLTLFNNTTTGGNSYSWNFGSGSSVLQNPSFGFPGHGTYPVQLIVTSAAGCVDSISQTITVDPIPTASFISSQLCSYNFANFTNTSNVVAPSNIVINSWNFGDPASQTNDTSSLLNPSHNFSAVGSYTVTLVVTTNSGCTNTISQPISVIPPPTALFTATTVCQNALMQFTNQSINATTYFWDFGTSALNDTSTQANPSFTYTTAGTYSVTLITDPGPCSDTSVVVVTVWPLPVVAFTAPSVCFGNITNFTNQSTISSGTITAYAWNFGNPTSTTDTSTLLNTSYQYTTSGTFNVNLICVSSNGCVDFATIPVFVNTLPVANFSSLSTCLGSATILNDLSVATTGVITNWMWDFGDGSPISNQQNPSHIFPNDSTFNTTLIVTNTAGCIDTINFPVIINPLPITAFSADTFAGCSPLCVTFIDQSSIVTGNIVGWSWDFGDNSALSTLQNPTHCYSTAGLFTVTLSAISNGGCITTFVIPNMITVYPSPTASFLAVPYVTSILAPSVSFTDLTQGNPSSWHWNFGDLATLSDTSIIPNPQYTYTSEFGSVYDVTLTVTNQNGCSDDTLIQVIVEPDFAFYIPTAFTPNDDGKNDGFFGSGYGITEFQIWIFDRWGNLIFTTKDISQAWDGTVLGTAGEVAQIDVYVWRVNITDVLYKKHNLVGTVTLIK
jgi:gliding motility-associated-like protein